MEQLIERKKNILLFLLFLLILSIISFPVIFLSQEAEMLKENI